MFSSLLGVAMQRVALCLNWCTSTGNPNLPPQPDGPKGKVEYWKAGCREIGLSGLDEGKEREFLPIRTVYLQMGVASLLTIEPSQGTPALLRMGRNGESF